MSSDNVEWTLSDFVDAIAAEVDRAQDTLTLKSYARGMSVSLKGLDLDIAVDIRMDPAGRVFFRTVEAGTPSSTVLKLDFEEVLQTQVEEVRAPADMKEGQPVETLPGITQAEIDALAALSITTVEGLLLYARTPGTLRDLASKSRIAETRLRKWLGFPYLARITPPKAAAGQEAVIEGGNLGVKDGEDAVLFSGKAAEILSWSESRIVVKVPPKAASGAVYARIDGSLTNILQWGAAPEGPPPSLPVKLMSLSPAKGTAGSSLSVVLQGSGFAEGITISFGPSIRVEQVTLDGPGQITARLILEEGIDPGTRDVTAVLGAARDTLLGGFTVEARPQEEDLAVTSVTPNLGVAGLPLPVEVLGRGFREGVSVTFGPKIQLTAIRSVSPTKLQVLLLLPATAVGRHGVTVTNPDGKMVTLVNALKVVAPPKAAAATRKGQRKQE